MKQAINIFDVSNVPCKSLWFTHDLTINVPSILHYFFIPLEDIYLVVLRSNSIWSTLILAQRINFSIACSEINKKNCIVYYKWNGEISLVSSPSSNTVFWSKKKRIDQNLAFLKKIKNRLQKKFWQNQEME